MLGARGRIRHRDHSWEDKLIALYAFPRSGGTLLSTILTNHPDVVVTSELQHGKKPIPGGQFSWEKNIKSINLKFGLDLSADDSFTELDNILKEHGKQLVYRVWVPGYVGDFAEVSRLVNPEKDIILLRNFFHLALSAYDARESGRYHSTGQLLLNLFRKIPNKNLFYWFEMYKPYIEHALSIKDKLIIHYEDLVRHPSDEIGKVFDYLQLDSSYLENCLNWDFKSRNQLTKQQLAIISGDPKIKRTSSVKKSTRYPRWRIKKSSYQTILDYLRQYPELKYLGWE